MIARGIAAALVVGAVAAAAQTGSDTARAGVQVRSWVSRTAVWVGDPVEFVVELSLAPHVGVIGDDLAKEKLKLEGVQVVSTATERDEAADGGTMQRFRYVLASYDTAAPALRIGAWPVRYYVQRPGERAEDVRPAGEVEIPGATIARRSTLPDDLRSLDLRAVGAPADPPRALRGARISGLALILLAAAPLATWTGVLAMRWRSRAHRVRPARARAEARSSLGDLRTADAESASGRRDAYERLERALRRHFAATRGIPADALVSRELAACLQALGSRHADAAGELLAECERARYGPPDRLPSKDRFMDALDTAERIFADTRP